MLLAIGFNSRQAGNILETTETFKTHKNRRGEAGTENHNKLLFLSTIAKTLKGLQTSKCVDNSSSIFQTQKTAQVNDSTELESVFP